MEIYERIKARRKELGLSADDVASALGVSRATIYRYESADIEKLPTQIIVPLAEVLRCSPAWLMGWEESKDILRQLAYKKVLLEQYSHLSPEYKELIDELIIALDNKEQNPDSFLAWMQKFLELTRPQK